ncbi:tyrosine-type recombinase/integrase [Spirosoma panaciterrae]|uniref:tyrosine-type recombinase/integrase n=1 Tax=Spirosoma panaciterrae TaxID=496058 RepID=UPI001FE150C2|nr:tyrosine-type recombinase/integrase [Spirosoma panaciterrae]
MRPYLVYCLTNKYSIDRFSLSLFAAGLPANRISPLRKFLLFYQIQGLPQLTADPPPTSTKIPAANELILGFLHDSITLRGEESRDTYTKSLNAFFRYLADEQGQGNQASFSGQTVGRYVEWLKKEGLSAFTVNIRLSAIKQLAAWVIKNRSQLGLVADQVDSLRDVDAVRGLTTERKFYKDSLERAERDELLNSIEDAADRALVALLVIEGLRTVEVTRLRVGDIDFERKQLWVKGKGKDTRKDVHLFDSCAQALISYLQDKSYWPIPPQAGKALWTDLKTYQIRYRVDKYLRQLNLKRPRLSAHSLRHTTGQLLIQEGVEPIHVQRHLRHELFETTQFYIKKQTEKDYYIKITDIPVKD